MGASHGLEISIHKTEHWKYAIESKIIITLSVLCISQASHIGAAEGSGKLRQAGRNRNSGGKDDDGILEIKTNIISSLQNVRSDDR